MNNKTPTITILIIFLNYRSILIKSRILLQNTSTKKLDISHDIGFADACTVSDRISVADADPSLRSGFASLHVLGYRLELILFFVW